MEKIKVLEGDEVYVWIDAPDHIKMEMFHAFRFEVPGAKFMPAVRNRIWDGYINLFNYNTSRIYRGLTEELVKFAKRRGYKIEFESVLEDDESFSVYEAKQFYESLGLPEHFESRDFQLKTFIHCVRKKRALFVSPTGSGKSLMIYMLLRYYIDNNIAKKTLIVVDSVNLLLQMFADFAEYGFDADKYVHTISAGADKNSDKPVIVSTWQSASKQRKPWFDQFDLVIGDEAHKFKAKQLTKIMESLTDCRYRFGFTGSLDGTTTNSLVLQGLFGPHKQLVTTKQLQDDGTLAQLNIKLIKLDYSEEEKKNIHGALYPEEIKFLFAHEKRNEFIKKLALSLDGNTLILFRFVEHGETLFQMVTEKAKCPTYYVSGQVSGDDREQIRKIVNEHDKSITVASTGVFSTGTNIPNINNIIAAAPSKSQVMILQSIGRGLRKTDKKSECTYFDIVDDLTYNSKRNYTLNHSVERIKIYKKQEFNFKYYKVKL